jgi:hypothetical protein
VQTYDVTRTQYKVADFLSWQQSRALDLQPPFQRRSIWKPGAKSYLLDTVVRGLPTPIIFLRERIELRDLATVREVVDGQQRLRTLLGFIAPTLLADFDPARDGITIRRTHNPELAGRSFDQLPDEYKHRFLNYEFSTHVLPSNVDDREILMIFSRLNSTGTQLSKQELRNAAWFGEFKTLMYGLALEQLDHWRGWNLLNDDEIARMKEAELTSDIAVMMISGYGGKSQAVINSAYEKYDDDFPFADVVARRFRRVMDAIDEAFGNEIAGTPLSTENWFIPLYFVFYRMLWPTAAIENNVAPKRVSSNVTRPLAAAAETLRQASELPQEVQDASRGAATDTARRTVRLNYLAGLLDT